jgi:hypothetical protein
MFGYKQAIKSINLLKSFYILATCLNNVQKHGDFLEKNYQFLALGKGGGGGWNIRRNISFLKKLIAKLFELVIKKKRR